MVGNEKQEIEMEGLNLKMGWESLDKSWNILYREDSDHDICVLRSLYCVMFNEVAAPVCTNEESACA